MRAQPCSLGVGDNVRARWGANSKRNLARFDKVSRDFVVPLELMRGQVLLELFRADVQTVVELADCEIFLDRTTITILDLKTCHFCWDKILF